MADITIRNLDDRVVEPLRLRAARHGRSMEAGIRAILADAVREPYSGSNLGQAIMTRFQGLEGDLELPTRTGDLPCAAEFDS
jgi:plasmid stability protein